MIKAHRPNCLCLSCMSSKSWEIKVCKQVVNELWFDSIVGLWFIAILYVHKLDLRYNLAHKTCGYTKETSCSHLPLLFFLSVPVCLSLSLALPVCEKNVQKVCANSSEEHLQPFKDKMEGFLSVGKSLRSPELLLSSSSSSSTGTYAFSSWMLIGWIKLFHSELWGTKGEIDLRPPKIKYMDSHIVLLKPSDGTF